MSYRLEVATRELIDWIRNNVGDTDDWPAEMNFDSEADAATFCRLINRVQEILDDGE